MLEALAHPVRVVTLPANAPRGRPSWRALLTGLETAGDAEVRRALELRLGLLPPASVHARDALGLAVVAICLSRAGAGC